MAQLEENRPRPDAKGFSSTSEQAASAMQSLHLLADSLRQAIEASAFRAGIELASLDEPSLKFLVYSHRWHYGEGNRGLQKPDCVRQVEQLHGVEAAVHSGRALTGSSTRAGRTVRH
ncbi:hypothetical protein P8H27_15415 [Pseudomonas sp. sp1636]|uniref:hypothetical protein n=1 Tax=Pseudomonas sp. sp1636 TaxID=3036707 RepID=UPI0025A5DB75|nr:hypothetical protein [Pseudomonas sp. sp1636]MDM8350268.1 hypothetical protein [Pseudomonas sp. sp1636]